MENNGVTKELQDEIEKQVKIHYAALESILINGLKDNPIADSLLLSGLCDAFVTLLLEKSDIQMSDTYENVEIVDFVENFVKKGDAITQTLIMMKTLSSLLFTTSINTNLKRKQ